MARSTICGAKFPYSAVVTAAGASPSGAERPAKYPRQNPRNPAVWKASLPSAVK